MSSGALDKLTRPFILGQKKTETKLWVSMLDNEIYTFENLAGKGVTWFFIGFV